MAMEDESRGLGDVRTSPHVYEWVRDRGVCVYCGSTEQIQEDHLIARSRRGRSTVPACAYCNQSKGAKQPMVWLRWIKRNKPQHWGRIVAHNRGKRNPVAKKVHTIVAERA